MHGTLRTWTSTASTTCTLESPNHGKDARCCRLFLSSNAVRLVYLLLEICGIADMNDRAANKRQSPKLIQTPVLGMRPLVIFSIADINTRCHVWTTLPQNFLCRLHVDLFHMPYLPSVLSGYAKMLKVEAELFITNVNVA